MVDQTHVKTLHEAAEQEGIDLWGEVGLRLHFSPIPNWYHCILGFDCPRCSNPISWEWPQEEAKHLVQVAPEILLPTPIVVGASLLIQFYRRGFGHRWITLKCNKCGTPLYAENFDS